jgi:hypothetical protein
MSFLVSPGVETVEIDESFQITLDDSIFLRPAEHGHNTDFLHRLNLELLKKQYEVEQRRLEEERRVEEERKKLEEEGKNSLGFDPILISLVRRAMPNLIAYDVCGVQPMTGPTGLIFAMRSKYEGRKKTTRKKIKELAYSEEWCLTPKLYPPTKEQVAAIPEDLKVKWQKLFDEEIF